MRPFSAIPYKRELALFFPKYYEYCTYGAGSGYVFSTKTLVLYFSMGNNFTLLSMSSEDTAAVLRRL